MSERAAGPPSRPHVPPAFWALVLVVGCERAVLAAGPDPGVPLVMAAAALLAALALALACARRARGALVPGALVACAALGAALLASSVELARQEGLAAALGSRPVSSVELRVASDMKEGASGWRGRAEVVVDGTPAGEAWLVAGEALPLGERVRCVGRYAENDEGEWGAASRAQGLAGTVRVVRVLGREDAPGALGAVCELREAVLESLEPRSSDARALLAGTVCAWTAAMSERGLDDSFAACGVSHLVAVSGGHLALVCSALAALLGRTSLRPLARSSALLVLSGVFVLFCAAPASAVRAWAMSVVASLSELVGRRAHPLSSASVVGLLMALADPGVTGQLGFVLSIACVCGICLLGPYARYALSTLVPACLARPLAGALDALAMTLVAQLVTMPFACAAFSQLSLVAPLANVLLAPVFSVLLGSGLAAAALVWAPRAQAAVLALCDAAGGVVMAVVRALERLPMASIALEVDEGTALLALAVLVAGLLVWWPAVSRRRAAAVAGLAAALALAAVVRLRYFAPACVRVLDVGQGDAVLVTDGASSLLVDTGPPGEVAGALARHGVIHLDAILVTHLHDDHTGGLEDARRATGCERVLVAEGVAGAAQLGDARQVEELSYGDVVHVGSFSLEVVSPTGPVDGTENEHSVELLLTYDDGARTLTALFTGDAERDETDAAIARGDVGDVDVLKVGHHGSAASVSEEGARALSAEVAVASAGEGNAYGHPDPACVDLLEDSGALFLCTMDVGDVTVLPGEDGPRVETQRRAPGA